MLSIAQQFLVTMGDIIVVIVTLAFWIALLVAIFDICVTGPTKHNQSEEN